MTREQTIARLRQAMPDLRRDFGVIGLSLFGSVARGDDGPESDVDLLVEFDPHRVTTLITLSGLRLRLMELLGREVDVGTLGGLRDSTRRDIESELLRVA